MLVSIDPYRGARSAVRHLAELGHERIVHLTGPARATDSIERVMALGVMSAFRERGLSVPRDVSVVGFDDVPEAAYLYPPLTTVRQDFAALGQLMMHKILVSLEEDEPPTIDTPIPTHLVVRDSTRERRPQ